MVMAGHWNNHTGGGGSSSSRVYGIMVVGCEIQGKVSL